jgi:hypothetical protein
MQPSRRRPPRSGRPYAIGFALALPAEWNGRFLCQAIGKVTVVASCGNSRR